MTAAPKTRAHCLAPLQALQTPSHEGCTSLCRLLRQRGNSSTSMGLGDAKKRCNLGPAWLSFCEAATAAGAALDSLSICFSFERSQRLDLLLAGLMPQLKKANEPSTRRHQDKQQTLPWLQAHCDSNACVVQLAPVGEVPSFPESLVRLREREPVLLVPRQLYEHLRLHPVGSLRTTHLAPAWLSYTPSIGICSICSCF